MGITEMDDEMYRITVWKKCSERRKGTKEEGKGLRMETVRETIYSIVVA